MSDGAAWIRNMVEELFPDAQQILDFFHLCENVKLLPTRKATSQGKCVPLLSEE
ncbi:MAG: hypothetical protein LBF83_05255 [Spirochaetaceae bacterium]|nr:hypothetical protein [Spirochaetaceae bacterium]